SRTDHEVDIAGADLLQHLGLLPQLRAGKLVDRHRPVAHLHEFAIEEVRGDAVAGRVRLVIGETKMPRLIRSRRRPGKDANRDCDGCRAQPPSAHPAFLPLAATCTRRLFSDGIHVRWPCPRPLALRSRANGFWAPAEGQKLSVLTFRGSTIAPRAYLR